MKSISKVFNPFAEISNCDRFVDIIIDCAINIVKNSKNKPELALNMAKFAIDNSTGENSTKQAMLKGLFSKFSASKNDLLAAIRDTGYEKSDKLSVLLPHEKTDVRFFYEFLSANTMAKMSKFIEKVVMNSEHPHTIQTILNTRQKNPDIKVIFPNNSSYALDVKAGNNRTNIFNGTLGEVCRTENGTYYTVTNTKPITFEDIQSQRLEAFKFYVQDNEIRTKMETLKIQCMAIYLSSETDVIKNLQIQDKLFQFIAETQYKGNHIPYSFFYEQIVKEKTNPYYKEFREKLLPKLDPSFFDNKKKFKEFMDQSYTILNETNPEIIKEIRKNSHVWEGTGFENIADNVLF